MSERLKFLVKPLLFFLAVIYFPITLFIYMLKRPEVGYWISLATLYILCFILVSRTDQITSLYASGFKEDTQDFLVALLAGTAIPAFVPLVLSIVVKQSDPGNALIVFAIGTLVQTVFLGLKGEMLNTEKKLTLILPFAIPVIMIIILGMKLRHIFGM